jgi:farnesyl-diphosphate farnesyltransferase
MPNRPDTASDLTYQERVLQDVSRTFALTIPLLPPPLRAPVGTAYLVCRIADTVEDSAVLDTAAKRRFLEQFHTVVAGGCGAGQFAAEVAPLLGDDTLDAEKDLVRNTDRAIRLINSYGAVERAAIARCVRIMCAGMERFQDGRFSHGLPDLSELNAYCYHVAGVVGEMLTELFCARAPGLSAQRQTLMALSVPFGQGLQMTNILKDIWDDRRRNLCWLPRGLFARHGFDLDQLGDANPKHPAFEAGLEELIAIAAGCLDQAMDYCMALPASEPGMRRFCLWPVLLAVLTLRKIHARPGFSAGREVKVSRNTVRVSAVLVRVLGGSNSMMRMVYRLLRGSLPKGRATH